MPTSRTVCTVSSRLRGATPDLIERARSSAAEDVAHAHKEAQAAEQQLNSINGRIQQAAREAGRRAALTPQQRQAEQAAREQHAARQQTRASQAPLPAPRITGPEGPSSARPEGSSSWMPPGVRDGNFGEAASGVIPSPAAQGGRADGAAGARAPYMSRATPG